MAFVRLRTLKESEMGSLTHSYSAWTPTVENGDFSGAVGTGIFTVLTGERAVSTYYLYDDGSTLPADAIISSITIEANSTWVIADGNFRLVILGSLVVPPNSADLSSIVHTSSPDLSGTSSSRGFTLTTTVDANGAAWTRASVFSTEFGVQNISTNFRTVAASATASTGFDVRVDYDTTPPPPPVDISGSGGVVVAGDQRVIAAGAGVPPELHGNQWGLLQFVMRSRLEDRL